MALKSIPKDSSPKLDGIGSKFYFAYQYFVKEDLLEAAKEILIVYLFLDFLPSLMLF